MDINSSPTLVEYKKTMKDCIRLYYPNIADKDLDLAIDYSIEKRYKSEPCTLNNSYTNKTANTDLLYMADYIARRQPIVTPYGTMFMHHEDAPNPLADTIESFLVLRGIHKKEMFKYPKNSELWERYNLLQTLTLKV